MAAGGVVLTVPEITAHHASIGRQMRAQARRGWFVGDAASLTMFGARRCVPAVTTPELSVLLLLTRDRMHHSVGWWRNAEFEFCWHLSLSCRLRLAALGADVPYEDLPREEVAFWARVIFGEHVDKLWNEPGGTDPRLTRAEASSARFASSACRTRAWKQRTGYRDARARQASRNGSDSRRKPALRISYLRAVDAVEALLTDESSRLAPRARAEAALRPLLGPKARGRA